MAVINRTLAQQVWPAGDALGQRILMGGGATDSVWRTIVGIVGDVRHRGLDAEARPEIYLPHAQFPAGTGTAMRSLRVVLRTDGEAEGATGALRAALAAIDPDIPLAEIQTMDEALGTWAAERRLTMMLVAAFAVLALSLGAVGVYGVMAHLVVQRTREIGIRMALGAVPREILALVLSQGAWLAGLGIVVGVLAALVATRLLAGLLYRRRPDRPGHFRCRRSRRWRPSPLSPVSSRRGARPGPIRWTPCEPTEGNMSELLRHLRYGWRSLRRTPGFAAIAIATLALGIGATTTIFTVVNGVLLRPMPYERPERLANIWNDLGEGAQSLPAVSALDFRDYQTRSRAFEEFAAASGPGVVGLRGNLTGDGDPERVDLVAGHRQLLSAAGGDAGVWAATSPPRRSC